MKTFTLVEANEILREIKPQLHTLRELNSVLEGWTPLAERASAAASSGGGFSGSSAYVRTLCEINDIIAGIIERGVEIKDLTRGLIDFPTVKDGRVALFCWQIGDGDSITWWHHVDAGFAGRKKI